MLRKKISLLLAVLLVCMLGMTACKKDVGTPEDNAVVEEDDKINDNTGEGGRLFG